ncbi:MAG TPA: hypothetical protein VIL20_20510 [Sandaracinaceae bacterium]
MKATWRTRALLLVAIVLSGVIAWLEVEARLSHERERPASESYEVEVEIAE